MSKQPCGQKDRRNDPCAQWDGFAILMRVIETAKDWEELKRQCTPLAPPEEVLAQPLRANKLASADGRRLRRAG